MSIHGGHRERLRSRFLREGLDNFEEVNAPYKQIFIMENMTHGLLESDSDGFSEIVHQIAKTERER